MALKLYSMKDILSWADPPEPGVVEELLYPGQLSLLIGAPKVGKTTLARTLALAVARGAEWMGRSTIKGKVIIIEVEGAPTHERDAFRKLGALKTDTIQMYVEPTDPDRAVFLNDLEETIEEERPILCIIDTLFRALHIEDGNDYSKALMAMDAISTVAKRTKCHYVLIHHARKGKGGSDNDLSLGSQALTGTSDTNLFLRGKAGAAWLSSEQRYGRALDKVKVIMDTSTGWVHADTGDSRVMMVLGILEQHPTKWITYAKIRDDTGLSSDALMVVVKALKKNDRVKTTGTGKAGDPKKLKLT